MEDAFAVGAGFGASELSMLIRTMIGSAITLWGGWVIWKQYVLWNEEKLTLGALGRNAVWMFLLIIMVLVVIAD